MRKVANKLISLINLNHRIQDLQISDKRLLLQYKIGPSSLTRYVMIKDRESGRRIYKKLTNKEISIPLEELLELNANGKFDFYLSCFILSKRFMKRTRFNNKLKQIQYVDEEKQEKFMVQKTIQHNLSMQIKQVAFDVKVDDLKSVGQNFFVEGRIESFKNQSIRVAELLLTRRDTNQTYGYKSDILPSSKRDNTYTFKGIIFLEKLKEDLITNSRWDVSLQLRDENSNVIYKELVNLQSYREFPREEERYIIQVKDFNNHVATLYATMGSNSMALWYTDQNQFERTYTIAKGKSVYNETCELESMNGKMVFFESFLGKNYSGNPKYLYEEMLKDPRFKGFTFVWSYSGDNPEVIPGKPILVNRDSEDYYKYLARSKYWVSNIILPVHRKRAGNVYIQTWHGTPLKKLGFDIDIEGPETLARENFYIESRNWDYLVAANRYSSEIFKRAFKFNKEMLEFGYPANDLFYRPDLEEQVKQLKKKLNLPEDKKIILYAPTWRDNEMVNSWEHSFQLQFDLEKFYQTLGQEYVLILRMHHLVSDSLQINERHRSFVYDFSKYDDIQELYTLADLLITDYSSVFFDYANSKKPILFYAYDYELYKENIRGFYLDMKKDLPGPVLQTEQKLLESIVHIDKVQKEYKSKYDKFYEEYCQLEDGKAAKNIIRKVFS